MKVVYGKTLFRCALDWKNWMNFKEKNLTDNHLFTHQSGLGAFPAGSFIPVGVLWISVSLNSTALTDRYSLANQNPFTWLSYDPSYTAISNYIRGFISATWALYFYSLCEWVLHGLQWTLSMIKIVLLLLCCLQEDSDFLWFLKWIKYC